MNIWQKIGLFFYDKKFVTIAIWLIVLVYGALSYTVFMRKEGFPSVEVPLGIVQVVSFERSPEEVDTQFALPLIRAAKQDGSVKDIATQSTDQGATLQISYERGTDVQGSLDKLKERIGDTLPSDAQVVFIKVNASKLTPEGDDLLGSVHGNDLSVEELDAAAERLVPLLKDKVPLAAEVRAYTSLEQLENIETGEVISQQVRFDRFFDRETESPLPSVAVGVAGVANVDQLELYDQVAAVLNSEPAADIGADSEIAVDFAESIREQVSGLQRNLFEGLVVVLVVSFILISLRASVVTAVSMTTTIAVTIGILNLIGYSINTITLFSLVLCLALIVDDTTIMVEAIDAELKKSKNFREVVASSLQKVVRASATGTFTTILAFAPMLFIGGILGEFIRAIPITIIISLLVSLAVSFVFIPLFMWLSYVRKRDVKHRSGIVGRLEQKAGQKLAGLLLWSTQSKTRSISVKLHAVVLIGALLFVGGLLLRTVEFNIFPAPKDGVEVSLQVRMKAQDSATIDATEAFADKMLADVQQIVGNDLEKITLLSQTVANRSGFGAIITLNSIDSRERTAVEIARQLQEELPDNYPEAQIVAQSAGVGPPEGNFNVEVKVGDDLAAAQRLTQDLAAFIEQVTLTRVDGTTAGMKDVSVTPARIVQRVGDVQVLSVSAGFDAKDVSALVTLAEDAVVAEFSQSRLESYGLSADVLQFDFGQEEENQESFASMGKAAGPLFLSMIILMAVLFKSLLQSLLILTALPFAFVGVAAGLVLTNNPLSFFVMLGIFALVGISVNNAILLTDFANQARDKGATPAEAMGEALRARLRPLLTTSITSILALLPLALNDPFWEGLAYTLIFGLFASTLLVIFVFPYFYLIEEGLRLRVRRLFRRP